MNGTTSEKIKIVLFDMFFEPEKIVTSLKFVPFMNVIFARRKYGKTKKVTLAQCIWHGIDNVMIQIPAFIVKRIKICSRKIIYKIYFYRHC